MATLLYLHGINVRDAVSQLTEKDVAQKLLGHSLVTIPWGVDTNVRLHGGGLSIPVARKFAQPTNPWHHIETQPLHALQILMIRHIGSELHSGSPMAKDFRQELLSCLSQLRDKASAAVNSDSSFEVFTETAAGLELNYYIPSAIDWLLSCDLDSNLVAVQSSNVQEYRDALARAIFFRARQLHLYEKSTSSFTQSDYEVALDALAEALRGTDRFLGGVKRFWDSASGLITGMVRNHFTELAIPAVGDVLFYQAHYPNLHLRIQDVLDQAGNQPVIMIGHSLGGVALFDFLCRNPCDNQVHGLVTFGSQAPFFYEMNVFADGGLPFDPESKTADRLPPHFPAKWLNIYDPLDWLSFIGRPLFGNRVTDIEIDTKSRNPLEAHGAYNQTADFWKHLQTFLA